MNIKIKRNVQSRNSSSNLTVKDARFRLTLPADEEKTDLKKLHGVVTIQRQAH